MNQYTGSFTLFGPFIQGRSKFSNEGLNRLMMLRRSACLKRDLAEVKQKVNVVFTLTGRAMSGVCWKVQRLHTGLPVGSCPCPCGVERI